MRIHTVLPPSVQPAVQAGQRLSTVGIPGRDMLQFSGQFADATAEDIDNLPLPAMDPDRAPDAATFVNYFNLQTVADLRTRLFRMRPRQARCWLQLAHSLRRSDERLEPVTIEIYKALVKHWEIPTFHQSKALFELSKIARNKHDYQTAAYYAQRAFGMDSEDPGLKFWYATLLHHKLDNKPDAIKLYREVLAQTRDINHKKLQAKVLIELTDAGDGDGQQQLQEALAITREEQDVKLEIRALLAQARLNDENKKQTCLLALERARFISDKYLQAKVLLELGHCRDGHEQQHYRQALEMANQAQVSFLQVAALTALGEVTGNQDMIRQALDFARNIHRGGLEVKALIALGNLLPAEEAIAYYRQAQQIAVSRQMQEQVEQKLQAALKQIAGETAMKNAVAHGP